MRRNRFSIASFLLVMTVMTIICAFIWNALITDKLYHCTDDVIPGYLTPGFWVHGKVAYVREINIHDPMDKPDTIREGWSEGGLWLIWSSFFGVSLLVATWLAGRSCRPANGG